MRHGPVHERDQPLFHVGLQNLLVVVAGKIVIHVEMLDAHDAMIFNPLFEEDALVFEYATDGGGEFLGPGRRLG